MKLLSLFSFSLMLLLTGCKSKEATLHLYTWAEYIRPELIEQFEKEHNCSVVIDTYDSNESMFTKLNLGATGYDLIFPSNYILDIMKEKDMVQDIDSSKLSNLKYVDQNFLKFLDQTSSSYGVPYMITYTGIGYRKDKVKDVQATWGEFGRQDLRGRMTMLNDIREVIGAALKFLGYSVNTTNPKELEEAKNLAISWKKNLAKFESEQYKNGIASAEYLLVQGWSGDCLQVKQENDEVEFMLPKEGLIISCDFMVIPKHAKNVDLAHTFMNFLLEPKIAAQNMEYTFYLCPNTAAYLELPVSLRKNPALFPPADILDKSELIKNLGASLALYNKAWDEIKASNN